MPVDKNHIKAGDELLLTAKGTNHKTGKTIVKTLLIIIESVNIDSRSRLPMKRR